MVETKAFGFFLLMGTLVVLHAAPIETNSEPSISKLMNTTLVSTTQPSNLSEAANQSSSADHILKINGSHSPNNDHILSQSGYHLYDCCGRVRRETKISDDFISVNKTDPSPSQPNATTLVTANNETSSVQNSSNTSDVIRVKKEVHSKDPSVPSDALRVSNTYIPSRRMPSARFSASGLRRKPVKSVSQSQDPHLGLVPNNNTMWLAHINRHMSPQKPSPIRATIPIPGQSRNKREFSTPPSSTVPPSVSQKTLVNRASSSLLLLKHNITSSEAPSTTMSSTDATHLADKTTNATDANSGSSLKMMPTDVNVSEPTTTTKSVP